MFENLRDLNGRLNREALRVVRPNHVIFLCGGVITDDASAKPSPSLRDYLYRSRRIQRLLHGKIVLAEAAQELYRDTTYDDLISFEEDIARVASIVLVITESAGSLAELGAFASEPVIRDALRIIISERHFEERSFVRWGPVKRIEDINRSRVGIFPWRNHASNGNVIKASIKDHVGEISTFINGLTNEIDDTSRYSLLDEKAVFFDILWLLHLLEAAPPEPFYDAVRLIHPDLPDEEIRNKLFTLKICRWVDTFSYSGRDFHYLPVTSDPYDYAYLEGQRVRDLDAVKLTISTEFKDAVGLNRNILQRLAEKRAEWS